MPNRFVARHRASVRSALRYAATLLLIAAALVACTVWPTLRGWWETVVPAALASAIAALLVFAVVVNTPLELIPFVALYFDRDVGAGPVPGGFGRALYREAALSQFESPDPLRTLQSPEWHAPEAALPVLERLLAERPSDPEPRVACRPPCVRRCWQSELLLQRVELGRGHQCARRGAASRRHERAPLFLSRRRRPRAVSQKGQRV